MEKEVRAKRNMDMLSGSLFDKLLIFAIPLTLSSILQQLFNLPLQESPPSKRSERW